MKPRDCRKCRGKGTVWETKIRATGGKVTVEAVRVTCPKCKGSGTR